jgi:predicted GNAT family N-acyltransferase
MRARVRLAESEADKAAGVAVRIEVFVDEQKVPAEIEVDEHDTTDAIHFLAVDDETDEPIGAARIVGVGDAAKIGRVAVKKKARGFRVGNALMERVIEHARQQGFVEAVLDAQTHAIPFYEKLEFVAEGPEFDDAGIPHRKMRRRLLPR